MSKIYLILLLLITALAFSTCKKQEATLNPQPPDTDTFVLHPNVEMIWANYYEDVTVINGVIGEDIIIFQVSDYSDRFKNQLLAFNKYSGQAAWIWDNRIKRIKSLTYANQTVYFYDSHYNVVYAVDALTGEERWSWSDPDCRNINGLIVADGHVYIDPQYYYYTNLTALDAQTGSPTVIHRFIDNERHNYSLSLSNPHAWHNARGDLILAYSGKEYSFSKNPSSIENYIAYNITADSIYFEHLHYWPTSAGGRGEINVIGDKYVFTNTLSNDTRKIACMDLETQSIDWETTIPAKLINAHIQFYDLGNTWVSNSGNFGITYGIDPATGKLIWYNDSFHYGFKYPVLYSGYGWNRKNGQIVVFDPATSTIRYQIENKDLHEGIFLAIKNGTANQGWFSSLTIDPTTGYIYTCGENRLTCFQFIE